MRSNDTSSNQEQSEYWNKKAGQKWVDGQAMLDAELEPLGTAVMNRLELTAGQNVIDVGCGGGTTSRELAKRVAPGTVVGVDISQPLVELARRRGEGTANLRFELADAQTKAFAPAGVDVVFSRFGVMFFADPVAAFTNLRKALKPGGTLGFVCWQSPDKNPTFTVPIEAGKRFMKEIPAPPVPHAPGPFAFADETYLRSILQKADFKNIDIAPHNAELIFGGSPDIERSVDLAFLVGPLSRAGEAIHDDNRSEVRAAVREAFKPFVKPAGVSMPSATWLVTARS